MVQAVEWEQPNLVIHLGDCMADAFELQNHFPRLRMEKVPGNCDCSMETAVRVIEVEGKQIMVCHGHTFKVKSGFINLELGARERGVDIALFGHTHGVFYENVNGVTYINPGSIGRPYYGDSPSYAVLTLDAKTDQMAYHIVYIEENQRKMLTK